MPSSELSASSQLEILDSAAEVPETANIVSLAQELLITLRNANLLLR
jgi:hypothetical protein